MIFMVTRESYLVNSVQTSISFTGPNFWSQICIFVPPSMTVCSKLTLKWLLKVWETLTSSSAVTDMSAGWAASQDRTDGTLALPWLTYSLCAGGGVLRGDLALLCRRMDQEFSAWGLSSHFLLGESSWWGAALLLSCPWGWPETCVPHILECGLKSPCTLKFKPYSLTLSIFSVKNGTLLWFRNSVRGTSWLPRSWFSHCQLALETVFVEAKPQTSPGSQDTCAMHLHSIAKMGLYGNSM